MLLIVSLALIALGYWLNHKEKAVTPTPKKLTLVPPVETRLTVDRNARTTRLTTVLHLDGPGVHGGSVKYRGIDPETSQIVVQMSYDLSVEMGQPDAITVTIEPGNRLNGA